MQPPRAAQSNAPPKTLKRAAKAHTHWSAGSRIWCRPCGLQQGSEHLKTEVKHGQARGVWEVCPAACERRAQARQTPAHTPAQQQPASGAAAASSSAAAAALGSQLSIRTVTGVPFSTDSRSWRTAAGSVSGPCRKRLREAEAGVAGRALRGLGTKAGTRACRAAGPGGAAAAPEVQARGHPGSSRRQQAAAAVRHRSKLMTSMSS